MPDAGRGKGPEVREGDQVRERDQVRVLDPLRLEKGLGLVLKLYLQIWNGQFRALVSDLGPQPILMSKMKISFLSPFNVLELVSFFHGNFFI